MLSIGDVPGLYGIRVFEDTLHKFICNMDSGKTVGFESIDVWSSIQMQCFSQQDQAIILLPQTVHALQLSSKLSLGRCNVTLIYGREEMSGDIQGYFLGQVNLYSGQDIFPTWNHLQSCYMWSISNQYLVHIGHEGMKLVHLFQMKILRCI